MKQVILPLVIVDHTARLCLHSNAPLPLHIQFVQHLLVLSRFDGAGEFEKSIAERALAMVDMRNNAEIPKSFNGDGRDALFELRFDFELLDSMESGGYVEGPEANCGREAMAGRCRLAGACPDIDEAIFQAQT
jgi:hypothetical protein